MLYGYRLSLVSGCSVSLLNKVNPDIVSVITEYISLNFHQTIMGGTGHVAVDVLEEAVKKQRKDFVLIVEGSIPTKDDYYCTIGEVDGHHVGVKKWVQETWQERCCSCCGRNMRSSRRYPRSKNQSYR